MNADQLTMALQKREIAQREAQVALAGDFSKILISKARQDLLSTLLFFSIIPDNRPAKQVRTVTVHEPTFNEQGA